MIEQELTPQEKKHLQELIQKILDIIPFAGYTVINNIKENADLILGGGTVLVFFGGLGLLLWDRSSSKNVSSYTPFFCLLPLLLAPPVWGLKRVVSDSKAEIKQRWRQELVDDE